MKNSKQSQSAAIHTLRNWGISIVVLAAAWILCSLIGANKSSDDYFVPFIFVLAVLIISLFTDGYFYGIFASLVSVLGVNWAFTYPYMELNFTIYGYPTTFITMLAVSIVISTLTTRVKEHEKLKHETEQAELRANLLRAISHDLRTPLTSIIGSISTVIDEGGTLEESQRIALLSGAKTDAEWLVRMVENLLSITRINGGEDAEISKAPELLEEIIGECAAKFKSKNADVNLCVSIPDELVVVNVDAMLIEQVIMNLLENSVHHGKTVTEIKLTASAEDGFARITVADNGVGIDPAIMDDLFKGQISPADNNKFRGIGLAVCDTIVRAHKGEIFAFNSAEVGAVFEFTLPTEAGLNENQG